MRPGRGAQCAHGAVDRVLCRQVAAAGQVEAELPLVLQLLPEDGEGEGLDEVLRDPGGQRALDDLQLTHSGHGDDAHVVAVLGDPAGDVESV